MERVCAECHAYEMESHLASVTVANSLYSLWMGVVLDDWQLVLPYTHIYIYILLILSELSIS